MSEHDDPETAALLREPVKPKRSRTKAPIKGTIAFEMAKARELVRQAAALPPEGGKVPCRKAVRLRADMRRPVAEDNPYLRNADGSVQTRPCKNPAIRGGTVCWKHGGNNKQVRAKAQRRFRALVDPALVRLEALIEQNEHPPTALAAIRTVLERAGTDRPIGPMVKEAADANQRPIINIAIIPGGIGKPVVEANMQPVKVIEGEVVADHDSDGE